MPPLAPSPQFHMTAVGTIPKQERGRRRIESAVQRVGTVTVTVTCAPEPISPIVEIACNLKCSYATTML